ncbi:MAG TPA: flagellin [Candidatus Anaerobiospirillum pullistercoris]|uniref:Flagellin n=1 Tax=Candidatus Anaerobiospirillum pullistercoris TaxID=2838452 RepID=A0A9D1WDY7_9GAMM|nr:flagellin [Candidatus Anaerobiospirillum pullistercoris]
MALYVNTNVSSLNAQRKLTNATNSLNVSYQRLSSGLRINSAKDDAAGLQISDRLTSQINGLNQGNRNANDGIALAQTIEGAIDETTNMLQRIRTLAVQAATGTNTTQDRIALQEEVTELCEEITRIAEKTTFAGQDILNGTKSNNKLLNSSGQLFFQVGANAYDMLTLDLAGFAMSQIMSQSTEALKAGTAALGATEWSNAGLLSLSGGQIGTNGVRWSVSTADMAQNTLNNIDAFIQYVDSNRAALGAIQNRMESTIRNQSSIAENESDARSRIRDTDFASETAALTQNNIIQQASQTVLAQANQRPTIALNLLGQ